LYQSKFNEMKNLKKYLALSLVLATIAFDSNAQFAGGGMGGRRGKSGDGQSGITSENRAPSVPRIQQISQLLYDVRMRLLISPEQSAAWEVFYARYFDFVIPAPLSATNFTDPSVLQAAQQQLSAAQNRYTLAENFYEAPKSLYAKLSTDRQRTADQVMPKLFSELGNQKEQKSSMR
jgi:hypothetical protein